MWFSAALQTRLTQKGRRSPGSLDTSANEMAREQGRNNRYFSEERGIYVHVDEKEEKTGQWVRRTIFFGEETWLREQEHTFNFRSAMHSAGGTADGGSRCDYSRRSGVSLRRGHKVGFSLLVDNEIAKWASATTAPFFFFFFFLESSYICGSDTSVGSGFNRAPLARPRHN